MALFVVRHPPVALEPGICYGSTDVPLKTSWEQDNLKIYQGVMQAKIRTICSSPLQRCALPAQTVANMSFPPLKLVQDERIQEMNHGAWEGQSYHDLLLNNPDYRCWMNNWKTQPCPAGESLPQVMDRVSSFLQDWDFTNENVLLVTHAGIIRILWVLLDQLELEEAFSRRVSHWEIMEIQPNHC